MRFNQAILFGALLSFFTMTGAQAAACGGWRQPACPKAHLSFGAPPAPAKKASQPAATVATGKVKPNANGKPLGLAPNGGNGLVAQGGGNLISPGNRNGLIAQGAGN